MKKSIKYAAMFMWVVTVLSGGMIYLASDAAAQESERTFAQMIQGSWVLVSIYNEQDGKKFDSYGPNPRGSLILTPDGSYSMIIMRESLPKFAANNRMKGSVVENQAVIQGSHAAFGTYTVANDKEHTVNVHIIGSTFPNWDGQDQKRFMTVIGDELKVTNPSASIGGGTNYVIWKRAKSVSSQ